MALPVAAQPAAPAGVRPAVVDSVTADTILRAPATDSLGVQSSRAPAADEQPAADDTVGRRKAVVSVYSDSYGTRVTIHRRLSYAMVPLFAVSYVTGDQLLKKGSDAGSLVINTHRASATGVAALFTVNTVLGVWNLWEGRSDPIERKRKFLHAGLMMAANAGFTYAGVALADQAERSQSKRLQHRNLTLLSMGVSIGSSLSMLVFR